MVTKEQQLAEAIERMKALKLHKNTIADLKQGRVNVSKQRGALYWANEEEKEIIAKFEAKHNALVYHAVYTPTEFGRCFSMLFVGQYEDEWELDRKDIRNYTPIAMVINLDDEWCSDMGSIGVIPMFGGLIRTA